MNNTKSVKYGLEPETIEKRSLTDDNFREKYDFYRLNQVTKAFKRYKKHDINLILEEKRNLENHSLLENVF